MLNLHFQNSNPSYTTTHMHPHVSIGHTSCNAKRTRYISYKGERGKKKYGQSPLKCHLQCPNEFKGEYKRQSFAKNKSLWTARSKLVLKEELWHS